MNIIIKEMQNKDLSEVLNLYADGDIDNGNILSLETAKKIYNKIILYPNYKIYVARYNNKIVGTFSLIILDNIIHLGKSSGLVEAVVVDKNFRSKGIGKNMMEYAINMCKQNNCYKMSLSSNINRKKAHKFYEGLGFKKHGYSFIIKI